MFRRCWTFLGVLALAGLTTQISLHDVHAQNKTKEVYTDPSDPTMPPEFAIQGEYIGDSKDAKYGCQIIALGKGALQAVLLPGGLPGEGWDGKNKILMDGVTATAAKSEPPAAGEPRIHGPPPRQSDAKPATEKFPPVGQKDFPRPSTPTASSPPSPTPANRSSSRRTSSSSIRTSRSAITAS